MRRENFKNIFTSPSGTYPIVDLGGCPQAWISEKGERALLSFLGYDTESQKELTPFGANQEIDERILRHYDTDTRGIGWILVPADSHYKRISEDCYIDEWGIKRVFTGQYWDITDSPLRGRSAEDVLRYPFPDPKTIPEGDICAIQNRADWLNRNTDYIVCASHPVYGIFELGCWMFGFDDFLLRMALEPETVHSFFERILEYQLAVSEKYYSALAGIINFTSSGDDFATQASTFISADMFRDLIFPYFKKRIEYTKKLSDAKFLHHSCGNVASLIPSLIEAGVDILNPIQPVSEDMAPENLSEKYGGKIVFHGGFDTQDLLLNGTAPQIRDGVFRLFDSFRERCGYMFATAHIIQDDIPVKNIDALFSATLEYKATHKTCG